jgi:hypothetical protein
VCQDDEPPAEAREARIWVRRSAERVAIVILFFLGLGCFVVEEKRDWGLGLGWEAKRSNVSIYLSSR